MNRAFFRLRSGTMPTSTVARSKTPGRRTRSAHAAVDRRRTRSASRRRRRRRRASPPASRRRRARPAARPRRRSGSAADPRSRRPRPSSPRRGRRASATTSFGRQVEHRLRVGIVPESSDLRRGQSRSRAPSAHAPSRSAVMAQPVPVAADELDVGSAPAARTNRAPADRRHVRRRRRVVGDVHGVHVADQRSRVLRDRGPVPERGGTTSPVTANRRRRAGRRAGRRLRTHAP